jgi:uncharacterized protein YecE (DUF72 family)
MGPVVVGTSGYGYLEWVGPVYPADTKRDDCLGSYATLLPTVELNETAYEMPAGGRLGELLEKAGPNLSFSVKAHESLTHRIDATGWKAQARAFVKALEPLRENGRLEAVLLQFPPEFRYGPDERRYLDGLVTAFGLAASGGAPKGNPCLAVEFHDHAWYNNRVFDALRKRSVAVASMDLPELEGLPPVIDLVTAPLAYIRLHGRNARAWWGSDSASRYDYLYTDAELRAWAQRLRGIAARAERVLVYFNNYRRGQSAINAMAFETILVEAGLSPSPPTVLSSSPIVSPSIAPSPQTAPAVPASKGGGA